VTNKKTPNRKRDRGLIIGTRETQINTEPQPNTLKMCEGSPLDYSDYHGLEEKHKLFSFP